MENQANTFFIYEVSYTTLYPSSMLLNSEESLSLYIFTYHYRSGQVNKEAFFYKKKHSLKITQQDF